MKWQQLILVFIASICLIFAGNALAQTDININNTNLIRFGGSVTVPHEDIVLGFQPARVRSDTEFAVG